MKFIITFLLFTMSFVVKAQLSVTPKIGIEFTGLSYVPKHQVKRHDIKVLNPNVEGLIGLEAAITSNTRKVSLTFERRNLGVSIGIINDSTVSTNLAKTVSKGKSSKQLTTNQVYACLSYEHLIRKEKRSGFMFSYGAGIGIGFNHDSTYYATNQGMGHSTSFYGGSNYVRIELWTKPTGIGLFLHVRAALSYMDKKKRERIIFQIFWSQGVKKMLEHTIDYSYGYTPAGPGSGALVKNYKFNSRGTTFGTTLNFPVHFYKP